MMTTRAPVGTSQNTALSGEDLAALEADLGRLNEVAPGLGDRAVRYVASGTDTSVLMEIKSLGTVAMAPFYAYPGQYFGAEYEQRQALRRRALVDTQAWRPAVLHRFAILLDTMQNAAGQYQYRKVDPKAPGWLLLLITEVRHVTHSYGPVTEPSIRRFHSAQRLDELLTAAGEPKEALLHHLYGPFNYDATNSTYMDGLSGYLVENAHLVAATVPHLHADGRERLMHDLGRLKIGTGAFFDVVFSSAVGTSKAVRKASRAILQEAPAGRLLGRAAETLASGSTDERRETVELLAMLVGAEARDTLAAHGEGEKSKPVRDAIAAALTRIGAAPAAAAKTDTKITTEVAGGMPAIDGSVIDIPPVPPFPADTPLPAEALEPIRQQIAPFNALVARQNAEQKALYEARGWNWFRPDPGIDESTAPVDRFLALINGSKTVNGLPIRSPDPLSAMMRNREWDQKPFSDLLSRPDFTLWHLLRLVRADLPHLQAVLNVVNGNSGILPFRILRARLEQGLDFRLVVHMLAELGLPTDGPMRVSLSWHHNAAYADLDCPTLCFYFLEHLDLIEEALGVRPKSGEHELPEKGALQLLAWLPKIPATLLRPLLELALGPGKQARAPARRLLAAAAGIDDAIVARLADAKKEIRATTAEWIGERGMRGAVPALKAALKKKKSEEGRAALLTALARLGEDISEHFSPKALAAEAEKGLAKTPAKSLDWFPFTALPSLRWGDGKTVDPTVVKWWIVLADKLKDPAGNALFELYLDRLRTEDAERFGLFLLQTFIERDTATCSEEDALAYAKQYADQRQQSWRSWQQGNPERAAQHPFNYEQVFTTAKAAKLGEHVYSCSENKGLLGLTMRAPGPDAGALVRRYLKDHGNKVNQSKALLLALARNPSPAAIQVVLAAANRLKQKTVQALARELIDGIAERRGWSADELADRTIPSAGFDEAGEMELDCGEGRLFRAIYLGDGKIDLLNPDGKAVKALPAPRTDHDKEAVGESKKALANARKEVKQVEAMQRQRLYEAMCVERTWAPETWTTCLQRHPIAGRLCQRLVWLALDAEGRTLAGFRALEDGTLSGDTDDTVEIGDAAAIKLAHQALLPAADAEAWARHLKDYEVDPLFPQFGKALLNAAGDAREATAIEDRKGWMIDSFKLQSAAGKLGYERGEVGDGGGFYEYVKRFDGVGLRAVIEFSGSYVGANESFPCALIGLSFQRIAGQGRRIGKGLRLSEVPPVLLSEAWGDLHAVAAAGSGFDRDWEKKRYF
jgi:Domain of unknown function (DUF4132)